MFSTGNTRLQRRGGQNTMHCEVVSQCYRPHRLRPAPIDDKANCTCGCEVPLEDRPCCLTALFCARINNDGKQHGATQKMSMAGLALASSHLSTAPQDAGESEKRSIP